MNITTFSGKLWKTRKILLREGKKHTDSRVSSTPCSYPQGTPVPGWGTTSMPHPWLGYPHSQDMGPVEVLWAGDGVSLGCGLTNKLKLLPSHPSDVGGKITFVVGKSSGYENQSSLLPSHKNVTNNSKTFAWKPHGKFNILILTGCHSLSLLNTTTIFVHNRKLKT